MSRYMLIGFVYVKLYNVYNTYIYVCVYIVYLTLNYSNSEDFKKSSVLHIIILLCLCSIMKYDYNEDLAG